MVLKKERRQIINQLALERCPPSHYISYVRFFNELYEASKSCFGDYSFKQFSDDLGFGPTTFMHQITRGHRPFTSKACEKFLQYIPLKLAERRYLKKMIEYGNKKDREQAEQSLKKLLNLKQSLERNPLNGKMIEYFSNWYNPLVRELAVMDCFEANPKAISEALEFSISEAKIQESIKILTDLGYITKDDESGMFKQSTTRIDTGSSVSGVALRAYHSQLIDMAKESLRKVDASRRDVSAITIKCPADGFREIQSLLHDLQLKLMELSDKWDKDGEQVYQVNLQAFPLTKKFKRNTK